MLITLLPDFRSHTHIHYYVARAESYVICANAVVGSRNRILTLKGGKFGNRELEAVSAQKMGEEKNILLMVKKSGESVDMAR